MQNTDSAQSRSDLLAIVRAYPMLVVKFFALVVVAGLCTIIGLRAGVRLALQSIRL